jgi:hypothetical protein
MKFNPARKKRCGTVGVVLSVENSGPQLIKVKVTFQDKAKDPATGAVLRVDTANMLFPVGALANDPEMTEDDRAQAVAKMAATAAGIDSMRMNSDKEEAEEAARQARIEAEDNELAKAAAEAAAAEAAAARAAMEAAEARAAMEAAEAALDAATMAEDET